jgi:hypothetical protein
VNFAYATQITFDAIVSGTVPKRNFASLFIGGSSLSNSFCRVLRLCNNKKKGVWKTGNQQVAVRIFI